jgi:hypothetical protein
MVFTMMPDNSEAVNDIIKRHVIKGRLLDEDGYSINGADIILFSSCDKIMSVSSDDGRFEIPIRAKLNDRILLKAFFGVMSAYIYIPADQADRPIDIILRALTLKNVY